MTVLASTVITLTKVDAARRQLDAAIRLFLSDADPVPTHTLAAAAHEVLRRVSLARHLPGSLIKDTPYVRPGRQLDVIKAVNKAANFFKHAETDPAGALEFRPLQTCLLLFDSVLMHNALAPTAPFFSGNVFLVWLGMNEPDAFLPGGLKDILKGVASHLAITRADALAALHDIESGKQVNISLVPSYLRPPPMPGANPG